MLGAKENCAEINRRLVYAMRSIGQGMAATEKFCGIMDLGCPVSRPTYNKIVAELESFFKEEAVLSMKRAADAEVSANNNCSNITITGDGSWMTRGHSSQIGVCSVIGAKCGKVIDISVKSLTCKGCDVWTGPKIGPEYEEFKVKHSVSCTKNYDGSSAKMEVDGMIEIFTRSENERNVKYVNYVGDGDSKTFSAIVENAPYKDVLLKKIECVSHIKKNNGNKTPKLK